MKDFLIKRKSYLITFGIGLFFVLTNPSSDDFRKNKGIVAHRNAQLFIGSLYHASDDNYYLGVLANFIKIKSASPSPDIDTAGSSWRPPSKDIEVKK